MAKLARMPRWLVVFIVALVIPCYGFAAVGKSVALVLHDAGHALAHYADQTHHHDSDGSIHEDDSDASVQHLLGDDWMANLVPVVRSSKLAVLAMKDAVPRPSGAQATPPPFLEGPIRPPRSDSRLA